MTGSLNPSLYQINTRVWLNELSAKLGRPATLHDVSDEFVDWVAQQGFDYLWPLGVWQTGPIGRAVSMAEPSWRQGYLAALPDLRDSDITGSPFAIQAYRVHSDFGGDAALASLRERLKQRNVRLLLDFVPNHTARDHAWVTSHPEFYIAGTEADLQREPHNYARVDTASGSRILAYGRDPYFPGWPDTFQLNYRSSGLRAAMAEQLRSVASACDAVRCDMAMLLLPDVIQRTWGERARPADGSAQIDAPFWPEAIAEVRSRHPDFVFMAEVYWDREYDLQQQGFDYTYDKRLYDRLCGRDAQTVRGHLCAALDFQRRSVRFLENHDEPRAAATFPPDVHRAAAAIAFFVPGLRFFYEGELEGRRTHVSMHLGRRPNEVVDSELRNFYQRLLHTLKEPVFREGRWQLLATETAWLGNWTHQHFLAFSWEYAEMRALVAVNYGPTFGQCYVRVPWNDLGSNLIRLRDRLSDAVYVRGGPDLEQRGLYLDVPPWHAHVFQLEQR